MNKTAGTRIFNQGELSLSIPVPGWVPYLIRRLHRANLVYLFLLLALTASLANAQSNTGDLRLKVADPSGAPVRASVTLSSAVNQVNSTYSTDEFGSLTVKRLPYGLYTVEIRRDGFAPFAGFCV